MDTRSAFHQSLDELEKELLNLGERVEESIHRAVESLAKMDAELAGELIAQDDGIDEKVLNIEERCLRLIALQQPMASDLRLIGMVLKIAIDLERIADHAVDIAKVTLRLSGERLMKPLIDIPRMAEMAKWMLREALQAFKERSIDRAASLAQKEDEVDRLYSELFREIVGLMGQDAASNRQLTHLLMVAQHLERVADHSTNIGEGIIYVVSGKRKDLNV